MQQSGICNFVGLIVLPLTLAPRRCWTNNGRKVLQVFQSGRANAHRQKARKKVKKPRTSLPFPPNLHSNFNALISSTRELTLDSNVTGDGIESEGMTGVEVQDELDAECGVGAVAPALELERGIAGVRELLGTGRLAAWRMQMGWERAMKNLGVVGYRRRGWKRISRLNLGLERRDLSWIGVVDDGRSRLQQRMSHLMEKEISWTTTKERAKVERRVGWKVTSSMGAQTRTGGAS
ncbi:hypothetical protein F5887DRAFT_917865 [Amanita rubescens]|nr:hypothetical protein F5887DRAFT_917865 [Amanita rubescens]